MEDKNSDVICKGCRWRISVETRKPEDRHYKSEESLLESIDRKKTGLDSRRSLTEVEVERLTEKFVVEYTYNFNEIEGNTLTLREPDKVLRGLIIDQKPLKDYMEAVGNKEIGIRISEFYGLTINDVDLENKILNIDHQIQRIPEMKR